MLADQGKLVLSWVYRRVLALLGRQHAAARPGQAKHPDATDATEDNPTDSPPPPMPQCLRVHIALPCPHSSLPEDQPHVDLVMIALRLVQVGVIE